MESNVQKMREALGEIIALCSKRDYPVHELCEIERIAEAALSEPMRNCDVGTAEEQYRRFRAFCESSDGGGDFDNPCRGCELNHPFGCETVFANLPYKGEEGED